MQRPNVRKSEQDISRAFKRCSPEERQYLYTHTLPRTLRWYGLKSAADTLLTADAASSISLDHFATLFAGLTVSQQNAVIDRADRMRDTAQAQPVAAPAEAA
jgi:hypothetical protein